MTHPQSPLEPVDHAARSVEQAVDSAVEGARETPVVGAVVDAATDPEAAPRAGHPEEGVGRLGDTVARFDEAFDRLLEPWRDRPVVSAIMTAATNAGEFSTIWHVSSLVRGLVVRRPDQVLGLAVGLGTESLIVNQGLKRLFHRRRPTTSGDDRFDIRTPLTSSFPSGHASAAAFAATVLIGWDGRRVSPLWAALAGVVALSRPFVRIHHGSDVVAGVGTGVAMGLAARRIFRGLGLG